MLLKFIFLLFSCTGLVKTFKFKKETVDYLDNVYERAGSHEDTLNIIIQDHGYTVEDYTVTTSDGYILKIFRIPYGKGEPKVKNKPVVFLQHGLLCSSTDWVITGPNQALAFILADHGYDVWMGNARGNTYSRKHKFLNPDKKEFWTFSWHEIGIYDLPAMIDLVINETNQPKIHYIGHSQGTTSFFVMGSTLHEYNDKILSMHALAPVAFTSNMVSPFVRAMSPFVNEFVWIKKMLGLYEFMPSNAMMEKGGYWLCRDHSPVQELCANVLFLIAGYDSDQLNRTQLPSILANTPAGASTNQILHYCQEINSAKFRMYDFGKKQNKKKYGTATPPDYQLEKVTAPVFLYFSDNDWLAAVEDVEELSTKLGNLEGKFRVSDPKFNHLDYQWAIDAPSLLYDRVISSLDRMNDKNSIISV